MYRIETVVVNDSPMEVFLFEPSEPAGKGSHPAIILAQHIPVGHTGIENDTFTLRTAERYAENGYVVAVPFIFHWWPKDAAIEIKRDEFRDDWTALDLQASYDLLAARADTDAERIAIVGHCWGGRVSWLGACLNAKLAACVMFYGGRIKISMGPETPPAIELAKHITCPVAGFFGNDDVNPSPDDVNEIAAILSELEIVHSFHRYDGAGHAFQNFPTPERYNEQASEEAWGTALSFLAETLKLTPKS